MTGSAAGPSPEKSSPSSRKAQAREVAILDNESPATGGGQDETSVEVKRHEAGRGLAADHDGGVAGRAAQARRRACVAQDEGAHRACTGQAAAERGADGGATGQVREERTKERAAGQERAPEDAGLNRQCPRQCEPSGVML